MIEIKVDEDKIGARFYGDFDTVMTEFVGAVLDTAEKLGKIVGLSVEDILNLIADANKFCSENDERV